MLRRLKLGLFAAAGVLALALPSAGPAKAQSGEPIKIGFSMALTGPLAPNGKQALLGMQIWEEEINAKGGLLGRPVKLVYYDDQSQSAPVPGIYTKLLDVDKVDLIIGPYATVPAAAAMPVVMQKNKTLHHPVRARCERRVQVRQFFAMMPNGPDAKRRLPRASSTSACSRIRSRRRWRSPPRMRNSREGLRRRSGECQEVRPKIVYDRTYPPATTDFTPIVRAVQAANADLFIICSYPLNSVGIVKAVNEIGFKPKIIGGAMVGLQATGIQEPAWPAAQRFRQLRDLGAVEKMMLAGTAEFLKKYQAKAGAAGVDPLGYYLGSWGYAYIQVLGDAIAAAKSIDDDKLADYIRKNTSRPSTAK